MGQQRIAIVTDSGTDVPEAFAKEHGIFTVPLIVTYSEGSYRSGVDITTETILERFDEEIPKTSLPSPDDLRCVFEQTKEAGFDGACFVGISSGLSNTCQTAELVARMMDDYPVSVVDTKNIGLGAGLMVMAASKLAEAGAGLAEICQRICEQAERARIFFTVKDLSYLRKGGRISEPVHRIGSALNIKPVFTCDAEGKYAMTKKVRGWERAKDAMVKLTAKEAAAMGEIVVGTCCTSGEKTFEELEAKISELVGGQIKQFVRATISADLIVHTGPDLLGITVQPLM